MGVYKSSRLKSIIDAAFNAVTFVPGIYLVSSGGGLKSQIVGGVLISFGAMYDAFRFHEIRYRSVPKD